jgi:hypothetical protein
MVDSPVAVDALGLFVRVWMTLLRAVAFFVLVLIHKMVDYGLTLVIPPSKWPQVSAIAEACVVLGFMVMYIDLLWESVILFVRWKPKAKEGLAKPKGE